MPCSSIAIRRAGPNGLKAVTSLIEETWTASNAELLPVTTRAALTAENSIAGLIASRSQDIIGGR